MNTPQDKRKASDIYGRPWNKREYIIVLYHYFQHRGESHDDSSDYVKNLASILGRTPASVAMRLHNFASLDPEVTKNKRGLQNIGPLGRDVFFYWFQKLDVLKECGEEYTREAMAAIYSLGVLIWELFSPAWGQLDRSDTELPEPLAKIVLKATEKKPENRQSSAAKLRSEFLAALE